MSINLASQLQCVHNTHKELSHNYRYLLTLILKYEVTTLAVRHNPLTHHEPSTLHKVDYEKQDL